MPQWEIYAADVGAAVRKIIPYLEDTSRSAHKAIYFEGWNDGLGASAVLTSVARDPPPSLMKKFSKIIHLDCSRWKSRRALQRTIVQELKLPQGVMSILDRQDEEDDWGGIDESSRNEINDVGREILRVLLEHKCLVVFHNGSDDMIDLTGFGIPQPELFGTKVLWTFRGRLRLNPEIRQKVDKSHLYLDIYYRNFPINWTSLLQEEAREIARYARKHGVTPEIAEECCLYLLLLNHKGGHIMDYNWVTHASNYWVCDGIIQAGGQFDQAWEIAAALHQQLHLEDYSSNTLPYFGVYLQTPPERWIFTTKSTVEDNVTLPRDSTSFFLVDQSESDHPLRSLPNGMFHQSDNLRVLRLRGCTFNFSSPPFRCCRSLRFLGLDLCKDQPQGGDEKKEIPEMEFFRSLWVLYICNTDWELASSPEITEQMAANIREVHIKRGRFWYHNFAWRQLQNLRKLRVIDSTCPWKTGEMDEFTDMVKLELLDLSGNSTIQILPSLSGATGLKTLVLDGCVGLEHVGPEGLPPSLESFSLDAGAGDEAKISLISLVGCVRLMNFRLRGSLQKLEELDLSGTKVKTLDLKDEVVQVPCLQRVMLLGCEQLRAILWPEEGMPQLSVLCIDTRGGGGQVGRTLPDSKKLTYSHAYVAIMDMRFIQLVVLRNRFCWNTDRLNLHLCISATSTDGAQSYNKEKIDLASVGKIIGPPVPKSSVANPSYCTYTDVAIDKIIIDHDYSNAPQLQPSGCHVEIGEGIINTKVESVQGIKAVIFAMNKAESLHVHDNSSITTVIPEHLMFTEGAELIWRHLKRCRVERCPKLRIVFTTNYDTYCFEELETFWAADLPMTHCIWSKGRTINAADSRSFAKLRSIHLYCCPRLTFVLPLSWFYTLRSLETLHIVSCGDLRQVFPVEAEFLRKIARHNQNGVLEFPELKHIYMYELPKLQQICEAKMFAPKLEKVSLRGCWSLRRLPAIDHDSRPVVECEKDWWEKLDWDGLEVGHYPSLFERHHSSYYKEPLPRGSVLR